MPIKSFPAEKEAEETSRKLQEVMDWLMEDCLFTFQIGPYEIGIWKHLWFITIIRK